MKTTKDYAYINTGKTVTLADVIISGDIEKNTIIKVYDFDGKFITKGNWFQDNILDWSDAWGTAKKAGTGLTVSFNLV